MRTHKPQPKRQKNQSNRHVTTTTKARGCAIEIYVIELYGFVGGLSGRCS
jgi:hypothetical protein